MSEAGGIERVRATEINSTTMPIVDARKHPGKEQIRGAIRYSERGLLSEERLALPLPHEGRIVVYADTEKDAEEVAARLREQGYKSAAVLEGGFEAYREAGLPTEEITQEQPIPGREHTGIPLE